MKKIILSVVLLIFFGFTYSFGQAVKAESNEKSQATLILDDPKLSPQEKAQLMRAGEDNPAKIDEAQLIDPKADPASLPTEKDFGESNAKPSVESLNDPRLSDNKKVEHTKETLESQVRPSTVASQPAGEKAGNVINYRDLPAGGKDQPASDSPKNTLNYRDIQGPGEQPAGNIPNK